MLLLCHIIILASLKSDQIKAAGNIQVYWQD